MRAACTSGRQARGQVPTASAGEELWRHSHSLVSGMPDLPQHVRGHTITTMEGGTIYFSSTPPLSAPHLVQGAQEVHTHCEGQLHYCADGCYVYKIKYRGCWGAGGK